MQNFPLTHIEKPTDLISVNISPSFGNRLLNVFTRLNAKVGRRLLNEYRRLLEDINIDNQEDMEYLSIAPIRELRI